MVQLTEAVVLGTGPYAAKTVLEFGQISERRGFDGTATCLEFCSGHRYDLNKCRKYSSGRNRMCQRAEQKG